MKKIQQFALLITMATLAAASCKKPAVNNPQPVEQELITTIRLVVTNNTGFNKTFNYKVDNGFGSTMPGNIQSDSLELQKDTEYDVEIQVWNEAKTPPENITTEVLAESNDHLFFLSGSPATGAGSIQFSNGSKDDAGQPFNQRIRFNTGAAGYGYIMVTLKHNPVNKNAATADQAGGETDAQAEFGVALQ